MAKKDSSSGPVSLSLPQQTAGGFLDAYQQAAGSPANMASSGLPAGFTGYSAAGVPDPAGELPALAFPAVTMGLPPRWKTPPAAALVLAQGAAWSSLRALCMSACRRPAAQHGGPGLASEGPPGSYRCTSHIQQSPAPAQQCPSEHGKHRQPLCVGYT